jgi:hypothetical protein
VQEIETTLQRLEENIAFQGRMIATLDRGGHDVKAAKMFLRRLEAQRAKHNVEAGLKVKGKSR